MVKKINPIRETDDEARRLVHSLVRENAYAALAVNEEVTGFPLVSRVAVAFHNKTGIFFCASDLSTHSKCLQKDQRCSLMLGEPGKGDGLAYPRVTIVGEAEKIDLDNPVREMMRESFLTSHPKSKLYVDFSDFAFYKMFCKYALLNGGFGKAFQLEGKDVEFLNLAE